MTANRPFTPGAGPHGGEFFLPWRLLRERFAARGVELNTPDVNAEREVAFELHLNVQRRLPERPCYVYLYEDAMVRPVNADADLLARYRKVFTWNERLIDGARFVELEYPNDLTVRPVPGYAARDLFCVLMASNKALLRPDPRSLHGKRVAAIRHFEQHAPELFSLYGPGWDLPAVQPGAWGRVKKRVDSWLKPWRRSPPFPSWRGTVRHKAEVLDRARFCICYENSRGDPGYLSEKIFDCFTSGCVPIYAGTQHRQPPFPKGCFIDADAYANEHELLQALKAVDGAQFQAYQDAMQSFLASDASRPYSREHFCETLVDGILTDLDARPTA